MGGLEQLPNNVEFIPNLSFNAKNMPFIVLWNTSCIHMFVIAYAYACMHMQSEGFIGLYLPKLDLFAHKKLYFPF